MRAGRKPIHHDPPQRPAASFRDWPAPLTQDRLAEEIRRNLIAWNISAKSF